MLGWIDVVSDFLSSQGFGVIIGGLIAAGTTFFLERQRRKDDEMKRRQERFDQEIQRRNDAYIKFLSLKPVAGTYDPVTQLTMAGNLGLESALVFAYGSVGVALELAQSYPFQSWNNVKAVQDKIVEELRDERIGRGPLRPPNLTRSSKHWWQFRRRRE